MKKGILFDVDGTLWDSAQPVTQSWNEILKTCPDTQKVIQVSDMYRYMGHPMDEIGRMALGDLDSRRRMEIMERCMAYENQYLENHPGTLYPDVKATMEALARQGYVLCIVSNCQDGYIQVLLKTSGLGDLIQDFECFGRTGLQKWDNIRLVMERNHLDQALYLGDTAMDGVAASKAGIPFVLAAYGFGDTSQYQGKIHSLKELPAEAARIFASQEGKQDE